MHSTSQQQSSGAPRANLYRDVTDSIVRELEKGSVPWVKP